MWGCVALPPAHYLRFAPLFVLFTTVVLFSFFFSSLSVVVEHTYQPQVSHACVGKEEAFGTQAGGEYNLVVKKSNARPTTEQWSGPLRRDCRAVEKKREVIHVACEVPFRTCSMSPRTGHSSDALIDRDPPPSSRLTTARSSSPLTVKETSPASVVPVSYRSASRELRHLHP